VSRVFDAFLFCDELDILECRLRELDGSLVYRHVIVEAPLTHRGPVKPLVFPEHKERFAPWAGKIIYIVADSLAEDTSWPARIAAQRDYIREGLHDAAWDDVIILSDIDEIISPRGVEMAAQGEGLCFEQRMAIFCVDWEAPHRWNGPSSFLAQAAGAGGISGMRHTGRHVQEGAGWHLTWLGGPEAVIAKTGRYGHSEQDTMIREGLDTGRFLIRGDTWEGQCLPRVVDDTWPKWVYERGCPANWFRAFWQ
jgi:hypothetical protein